ncbi:methyltransferase domain-containing protein [Acidobacteria bacterium AH-259-A15]|nr:methyltransferase domain-containing protein [Acidobacteria bacterium AH-259-A15]
MLAPRDIYAKKALAEIPRLLSLQDRNPFSPTYGCFHRDYWLYKTSDFPDAVRQCGTQALALVYKYDFPDNIYKGQPKIADWAIAGLDFWAHIQHKDGSFDEFYPYERGWAGPSAFTTYAAIEAFRVLRDEIASDTGERVLTAIRRAAHFIAAGESEEDHLANHHAMACLAVWKAHELLDIPDLKKGFERLWERFLRYHNSVEGWSREYDGVDPGYLSATVSFLAKTYESNRDRDILDVLRQSVEFCSYFVYPNGFYAGSLGSRNTQHFYPHGFEILVHDIPMAAAVAEKMLQALSEGKLVPPEIMSDRYVFYRVPEFLQAYLAYSPRQSRLVPLPYQREPFAYYFPEARIFVSNRSTYYVVANLAKGGAVKIFDRRTGRLVLNDCGIIGHLADDRVVTSQWIDPDYECQVDSRGWEVRGSLQKVPSHKVFTPFKNLLFRATLVVLGWSERFSHWFKGWIRKVLMLGSRPVPVRFRRRLEFDGEEIGILDELEVQEDAQFTSLAIGGEFFVRYVPQSRFFQSQELEIGNGSRFEPKFLPWQDTWRLRRTLIPTEEGSEIAEVQSLQPSSEGSEIKQDLPFGVYGVDYHEGRRAKRQLIYRLRRRTDEVEGALRRYSDRLPRVIVDLGTADGLMLDELSRRIGSATFFGLDLSYELLRANPNGVAARVQADALSVPLAPGVADAVIATAVIEHVSNAKRMVLETCRILRSGGLLILTTPDPLLERIATRLGVLKDPGHQKTYTLRELCSLVKENGFEVVHARKFMFSPVGFPAEKLIERGLTAVRLYALMANQLLVARKKRA